MTALLDRFDMSATHLTTLLQQALINADDGELFMEHRESEVLVFDNGRLKHSNFVQDSGFGLRALSDEATAYAHANEFTQTALARAAQTVKAVNKGSNGTKAVNITPPSQASHTLYAPINPLVDPNFAQKLALLQEIDTYIRAQSALVHQVTISLATSYQHIEILRDNGYHGQDIRPLTNLRINVIVAKGQRLESGFYGYGGREPLTKFIEVDTWKKAANEALQRALINLEAAPPPAGTFDVVLANGWTGVMLHEAVGHGLEGDANRKKTSVFAGKIGEYVAAKGVTIVDDGTLARRRGSLNIDDEGTPTQRTTLIENGKLVGYMQDRLNGRLMGGASTGNGRRESYAHIPIPRMTNTFMINGTYTPEEILASVKKGIYAVSFGGGQVDVTSGKFVFECTQAYLIENGKVTAPLKGATLIGNGPEAMQRISMIGNDSALDEGIGTCGKAGQNVPVGVGQPHVLMNNMTIGGTSVS